MVGVRLIALVVSVTLTGPATLSLLCDWACAVKHERAAEVSGGCQHRDASALAPTISPGHKCHELTTASASISTSASQPELLAPTPAESSPADEFSHASAGVIVRPPGASHSPPPSIIPLRI